MSPSLVLLLAMAIGHGAGAAGSLFAPSARSARGFATAGAVAGSGAGMLLGLDALIRGTTFHLDVPQLLALAGGVSLGVDRLGAFFLVIVQLVAVPAALFGGTYSRVYDDGPSQRPLGAMLNLFLLALGLVPLADNVVTFALLWELMSVASYFLVMTESDRRETRQAGLWYLAMAHGGLLLTVAAFLLLGAGAPSTGFADLRVVAAALPASTRNVAFLLALIGFGSKAGLVPLHVWLPLAHPAAPSHVSALMSGAMVKLGVYGLLRIALDLLGGGPPWWGGVVLAAGAVSALLGVLYALMEQDLKRLLAYSTVENIGIVFLGIGAGMMFQSYGLAALGTLGLVAGLYHALNHACFKGLLFLGTGAVLHATHTRNMEELGGLIKGMPRTALAFLLGAAAISGLPPLNGFVSEWLVFQTLLGGPQLPRPELGLIMAVAVGMLALTSGLAVACFVKAFGISFLAIPRTPRAAQAQEVPVGMQVAMGGLALACIGLGVGPALVVPVLRSTLSSFGAMSGAVVGGIPRLTLEMPGTAGVIAPVVLAAALALLPLVVVAACRLGAADRRLRVSDTWGCGRIGQTPRMEYTATAFAEPLRRVFAELYRPTEDLSIDFHPESRYFVQSIAYRSGVHPWFERRLYAPVVSLMRWAAFGVRWLQAGSLHLYLLYMILTLVVLLLASRWPS
jgi:hydrogenase-4 component B